MLANRFFELLRPLIDEIERTQLDAIDRAAEMIVASVTNGGCVHLYDTGHVLEREAVGRAGGLFMITPLSLQANVNNPARPRPGPAPSPSEAEIAGWVSYALTTSKVRAGDVLIVGSVSGRRPLPMEVAIQARRRGAKVIALTSLTYSNAAPVEHSSGKRLHDVADLVIDNVGVVGDALVEVPELEQRICPGSGITAAVIIWALTAQVVERLMARGLKPSVWTSVNLPSAADVNNRMRREYEAKGY